MQATEIKSRPILFSGEMVRAILDGRKTQTRRIVKPQPNAGPKGELVNLGGRDWGLLDNDLSGLWPCPYGATGSHLWVKEAHRFGMHADLWDAVEYKADGAWMKPRWLDEATGWKFGEACGENSGLWRSPIFMPRWASRILLEVTDVRVERVQDISAADVAAEGTPGMVCGRYQCWRCNGQGRNVSTPTGCPHCGGSGNDHAWHFQKLWDSINAKRGYGWTANPWTWVVSFKVIEGGNTNA